MTSLRKRDRSLLSNAVSLVLCGLLAGLVVAAAAFPAIAMSGLAAKTGADTFDKLPTNISVLPSPQTTYVYASDGKTLLTQLYDEYRRDLPIANVAPIMAKAMVASEDIRFYDHNGVDIKGSARAFVANQQSGGKIQQGGSTLTMQYVRQVISYSARTPAEVVAATERTPMRKAREMRLAIALEKQLSKEEILERYLNIASFGHGAYGIYAAANVYFNKDPKDLTLPEAALLAGLVKAPSDYDPATEKGRPRALERRKYVLDQMIEMKQITEAERDEALKVELAIHGKRPPRDCTETPAELGAGFFCDYLVRWWNQQPAFGVDSYERENRLRTGGYSIVTSLDIPTQMAAFAQVQHQSGSVSNSKQVDMESELALMLAAVVPGKGWVSSIAINRKFSNDDSGNGAHSDPEKQKLGQKGNYPNTTVPFVTGGPGVPGYQGGSTFKIFTVAAALEKGYPLSFTLKAEERARTKYAIKKGEPAACPGTGFYCPGNAAPGEAGVYDMWGAFGRSVNTFFVPLQEQVGSDAAANMAARAGITFNGSPERNARGECGDSAACMARSNDWGAFTLGVADVTPLELANAYATFAADGVACATTPVIEIRDKDGKKVDGADPQCKAEISPEVARGAIDVARCPIGDKSSTSKCAGSTARSVRGIVDKPIAGKTGTTDHEKNAILVTTTPHLAVAGFLTDPDFPQHEREMSHDPVNNAVAYTLRAGAADDPPDNFTPPSAKIVNGNQLGIPDVHCAELNAAKTALRRAGFDPQVAPEPVTSDCPAGSAASTQPTGKAPKGAVVTINVSKGGGQPAQPGQPVQPGQPTRPGRGPGGGGPGNAPADCILCPR